MALNLVDVLAEGADPLLAHLNELNEWVHVGSALLAADDGLVVKVGEGDRLTGRELPKRLYNDGQRDSGLFCHLCSAGNAVGGYPQN